MHGFSVWAVVGGVGLETAYHVDYAEVYRRRTNVIIPPVHAATLQVSPVAPADVEGGTFGAHSGGLDHYRKLGYKCRLAASPAPPGQPTFDWGQAASPVGTCGGGEGGGCWEFAPYAFRQATLCCGELPHAADRVVRWPASHCRVVVGINSMGFVEGPTEMSTCGALGFDPTSPGCLAPPHSYALGPLVCWVPGPWRCLPHSHHPCIQRLPISPKGRSGLARTTNSFLSQAAALERVPNDAQAADARGTHILTYRSSNTGWPAASAEIQR